MLMVLQLVIYSLRDFALHCIVGNCCNTIHLMDLTGLLLPA